MKYKVFDTVDDAMAFTEDAGRRKGLAYHKGDPDGTRYLWGVVEHPTDGRGAVVIGDYTFDLSEEEVAALLSRDDLDANGWFPNNLEPTTE
jgi:hypothetical protein